MKSKTCTGLKLVGTGLTAMLVITLLAACGEDNKATQQAGSPTTTAGATIESQAAGLVTATTTSASPTGGAAVTAQVLGTIPPIAGTSTMAAATTAARTETTVLPIGEAQRPSLADNSRLKTLTVDKQSSQKFAANLLGGNNPAANTQYFATRDSFENILAYYDKALAKDYKRSGQTSISSLGGELSGLKLPNGTVVGYEKQTAAGNGAANLAVINIGPVDKTFLTGLGKVSPEVAAQLAEGDRLIIVLYNVITGLG